MLLLSATLAWQSVALQRLLHSTPATSSAVPESRSHNTDVQNLLPLFGTGSGGADLDAAIDTLFDAVLAWFDGSPASALQRVHFQVFDERQLASCRRVLARLQAVPA